MPIYCVAPGCKSNQLKSAVESRERVIFHRFPSRDSKLTSKWEEAMQKVNSKGEKWKATPFSHLCSKHFLPSDYVHEESSRLKKTSVPSVFGGVWRPVVRDDDLDNPPSPGDIVLQFHNYARPYSDKSFIVELSDHDEEEEKEKAAKDAEELRLLRVKIRTVQQKIRRLKKREAKKKNAVMPTMATENEDTLP